MPGDGGGGGGYAGRRNHSFLDTSGQRADYPLRLSTNSKLTPPPPRMNIACSGADRKITHDVADWNAARTFFLFQEEGFSV